MNNQTFEEFYLKYRKISRGYAYGVLHDWSAADDVSQDVLYKDVGVKRVCKNYLISYIVP